MNKKEIGTIGENLACKLLVAGGFEILARNISCRFGEIDIACRFQTRNSNKMNACFAGVSSSEAVSLRKKVFSQVLKGPGLYFIEVKLRSSDKYGRAVESMNWKKLLALKMSADSVLTRYASFGRIAGLFLMSFDRYVANSSALMNCKETIGSLGVVLDSAGGDSVQSGSFLVYSELLDCYFTVNVTDFIV